MGLLNSKTVLYVTHQVEFLPAADLILVLFPLNNYCFLNIIYRLNSFDYDISLQVMKDGRISEAGKYNDLLKLGSDFMELVGAHQEALTAIDTVKGEALRKSEEMTGDNTNVQKDKNISDGQNGKVDDIVGTKGQIVQEEEREKGSVGFSVYWKYITTAYGGALVPFMLLAQVGFQLLQIGSNYWMAWATPVSKSEPPPVGSSTLIIVYVALGIASALCILARTMLLVTAGYKTASLLFHKMHLCIFRAPMSFFDATPSGRILNRVSE